jgi:DNA-binding NtrC family response regulator
LPVHAEVRAIPDLPFVPLVAVLDSSQDIVTLIQQVLVDEGYRVVTLATSVQLGGVSEREFLLQHQPQAVVCAVGPPYEKSWAIFRMLATELPHFGWVVTTTNAAALEQWVGPTDAIELIGKPFDLDQLVEAVHRAIEGPHPPPPA